MFKVSKLVDDKTTFEKAALMRYQDAGIEQVQIIEALDERTCPECGKYHEKVYPIDKCPVLPFHPNCRCTIVPYTESEEQYVKLSDTTDKWATEARKELLKAEKTISGRAKEVMEVYGPDGNITIHQEGHFLLMIFGF